MKKCSEKTFENAFIRQSGRILPFGCIRIYANGVIDDPTNDSDGQYLYSEELLPYRGGNYHAEISKNQISITGNGNEANIPFEKFYEVHVDVRIVSAGGFLDHTGYYGSITSPKGQNGTAYYEQLLQIIEGKTKPSFYDNSSFLRVDTKLIGKKLITITFCLYLAKPDCRNFKLFTASGKQVKEFKVEYPLREKKRVSI